MSNGFHVKFFGVNTLYFNIHISFLHMNIQFSCFILLFQPFCSLHLQLQMSENPYLSGAISTKSSAPGIIVATGERKDQTFCI